MPIPQPTSPGGRPCPASCSASRPPRPCSRRSCRLAVWPPLPPACCPAGQRSRRPTTLLPPSVAARPRRPRATARAPQRGRTRPARPRTASARPGRPGRPGRARPVASGRTRRRSRRWPRRPAGPTRSPRTASRPAPPPPTARGRATAGRPRPTTTAATTTGRADPRRPPDNGRRPAPRRPAQASLTALTGIAGQRRRVRDHDGSHGQVVTSGTAALPCRSYADPVSGRVRRDRGGGPGLGNEPERGRAMANDVAVRVDGVVKRYGEVTALDGASFQIRKGETVALLGPNGAGKSTTVGILLGLLRPDAGRAQLFGGSPHEATAAGRVGAMLQHGDLPEGATVAELVRLVHDLYPAPGPLEETLELAGLTSIAGRRVERLSGGQAQRVRYALAIAGAPELLFLDEPTVGMDVQARQAFWRGARQLAGRGATVLFATHYLEEADDHADRIVVLVDGRVVADGPATAIKANARTRRVSATVAAVHDALLRGLPGVRGLQRHGESVLLESADADATVRALFASGVEVRDLEVTGADLEQAFLTLTNGTAEEL